MTHKLTLTNGAASLLSGVLNAPGKVQGLKELSAISKLAMDYYEGFKVPDESMKDNASKWFLEPFNEMEITEGQRDAIKIVITRCADEKILPPSKFALELLTKLGLDS